MDKSTTPEINLDENKGTQDLGKQGEKNLKNKSTAIHQEEQAKSSIAFEKNDDKPQKNISDTIASKTLSDGEAANGDGGSGMSNDNKGSFADKLYRQITSIIGGDNPNQFFCMGLPGTAIEPGQYSYMAGSGQQKPAMVEANESKLVNKLFDACRMTAADNGKHLHTQYKTSLDMLTPKLNSKLSKAKTELRKVLMTPYPYNFGDGESSAVLTLQQVFYKLYADYVEVKQKWAKMQADKKEELVKAHPGKKPEDYKDIQNEYLEWYGTVAETQVLMVEEKLGKVLSVFSPGDMQVIMGILDSGSGREVAEAREALTTVQKLNPGGGYVYPVSLYPEKWFTLLTPSFTSIDLLESPAAISQKMETLVNQRGNLKSQVNALLAVIPEEATVKQLKKASEEAEQAYGEAQTNLAKTYATVTVDMVKAFAEILASPITKKTSDNTPDIAALPEAIIAKVFAITPDKMEAFVVALTENSKKIMDANFTLNKVAIEASKAALTYFEKNNLTQYKGMIAPLQEQIEKLDAEIKKLEQNLSIAIAMQQKPEANNGVAPRSVPDGFTQVIINSEETSIYKESSSSTTVSKASSGASFFFGGYSKNESHEKAVSETFGSNSSAKVEIGMSLAKVVIGREWFNPGVFKLTSDMYNSSSVKISPQNDDYPGFSDDRFTEMNKCIFPCFPTAFIVAKDVTIRFFDSKSLTSGFAKSVEEHAASGGGFFIFSGSSSSSSSSSESKVYATSNSSSVTVRFTQPQILGYYLEATPADKSIPIDAMQNSDGDHTSIMDFVNTFQKMLDEYNKTYNNETLHMNF